MVCISAISAGYVLFAAISSYLRCLLTKAWLFFVTDQVLAYLMVTSMAALGEFIYLAYNGDRVVSWSRACGSYGNICSRLKVALALHSTFLNSTIVFSRIQSGPLHERPSAQPAEFVIGPQDSELRLILSFCLFYIFLS
ncbi:CASP-like protein 2d1 [Phtheirospermum japonicum]|uniref:CASP-like protein n=1 Tax=Phtheirospermum japonicum TaxID=374723 RepID=A0A830CZW6_9LAMI|nr:CASP-like protein 2d1 [Phtheirospermum japonicum]